ncbi:glycosyltransferase family protein [Dictyoglomus thermophilum]|uniref:Lipid-A-disaccharide synthase n=2 Tax=Dictyoglomus thermophilum TaxID=14 RepID=B5YDD1_DICT6|nr:hypothetical protein [Dictyoglomus thermophilum]ACI19819.1 conserved hypothetical protein [Dictyoglomus thermophilum H-6-12]MCX7721333.1 hypothetical protein [Dictyoglomus thermophilum]
MKKVYFLVNGPGEISGWLYPLVKWIKEFNPAWSQDLVFNSIVVPCQFASGREEEVLKSWNFFGEVIPSNKYWSLFRDGRKYENSVFFHIGGDLYFNLALSKRKKGIPVAYVEKYFWGERFYRKVYTLNDKLNIPNSIFVGDLRFDFLPSNAFSDSNNIALFPGSRNYALKFFIPFYLALVKEIVKDFPDFNFTFFLSPFIDGKVVDDILRRVNSMVKDLPIKFEILDDMKKLNGYLMAITLPGTNTMQLAYMKIPMIVILPLHRPEFIPIEGIANLFKGRLREGLINLYLKKNPYLALPNKISPGIIPEIVGNFHFRDVLKYIKEILYNRERLIKIHEKLKENFNKDYLSSEIIWKDLYNEVLSKII